MNFYLQFNLAFILRVFSTCMNLFSKTVSVIVLVPSPKSKHTHIIDCMSVKKPGCGRVLTSTGFKLSNYYLQCIEFSSTTSMLTPISHFAHTKATLSLYGAPFNKNISFSCHRISNHVAAYTASVLYILYLLASQHLL